MLEREDERHNLREGTSYDWIEEYSEEGRHGDLKEKNGSS